MLHVFDTRKYEQPSALQALHELRQNHLAHLPEQEEMYRETFQNQSIRYRARVQQDHLLETFECMGGEIFTLYHDLPAEENTRTFFRDLLHHYGYLHGDSLQSPVKNEEEGREMLLSMFLSQDGFAYERETLVYRNGNEEVYLFPIFFDARSYAIKMTAREQPTPATLDALYENVKKTVAS